MGKVCFALVKWEGKKFEHASSESCIIPHTLYAFAINSEQKNFLSSSTVKSLLYFSENVLTF